MSFYGKIYQELANAFRGFKIGNKKKVSFPTESQVVNENSITIEARTFEDQVGFNTGNRWIQIVQGDKTNSFDLYHARAGKTTGETTAVIDSLLKIEIEELTDEQKKQYKEDNRVIDFGNIVTFTSIEYDKAGHIVAESETKYWLSDDEIIELKARVSDLEDRATKLEERTDKLEERADALEQRASDLEDRADVLEQRATDLEDRALALEKRAENLENRASALEDRATDLEDRALALEKWVSNLQDRIINLEFTQGMVQWVYYSNITN